MTKPKLIYLILIVAGVVGAFYWYEVRPSQIRALCQSEINETVRTITAARFPGGASDPLELLSLEDKLQSSYFPCLHRRGVAE